MMAVTNRDVEGGVVVDADEAMLYTQTAAECGSAWVGLGLGAGTGLGLGCGRGLC